MIEGRIQRILQATAKPGRGDELAELLAEAGERAGASDGCQLYLVARDPDDADRIWVTEIWDSMDSAKAALRAPGVPEQIAQAKELIADWGAGQELIPAGGLDLAPSRQAAPGYEIRNLSDFKDSAPEFGFGEIAEARFADGQVELGQVGFSHHRLKPGKRQAFGHVHEQAEEVYLMLSGSGQVKLDAEVRPIADRDVIRVGPAVTRAFEAGPDGLELLAFGASHPGDGELLPGWWS